MSQFTHLDNDGQPHMVDVRDKVPSQRTATAQCIVVLGSELMSLLKNDELHTAKGPVFQTAIIAGIMGAKKTPELIPMCHPIGLDNCQVTIVPFDSESIIITSTAKVFGKTGVEMEALTAASTAALTVYDMCKSVSKAIVIKECKLLKKTGGKSDFSAT